MSLSIAAVARETGINAATLRKWESRYGFPKPIRTAGGARRYTDEDVSRLSDIKRLIESGLKPSQVLPMDLLISPVSERRDVDSRIQRLLGVLSSHDAEAFKAALLAEVDAMGVEDFVRKVAAPMTVGIGEQWLNGSLSVYEEHFYSQIMQCVLDLTARRERHDKTMPVVLLTTLAGEAHTLGLDMVQAVFAHHGANCIHLGGQLPIQEIANAAEAYSVDVVALSFSAAYPRRAVKPVLRSLRALLPASVSLWVGGSGVRFLDDVGRDIAVFHSVDEGLEALAARHDRIRTIANHPANDLARV